MFFSETGKKLSLGAIVVPKVQQHDIWREKYRLCTNLQISLTQLPNYFLLDTPAFDILFARFGK